MHSQRENSIWNNFVNPTRSRDCRPIWLSSLFSINLLILCRDSNYLLKIRDIFVRYSTLVLHKDGSKYHDNISYILININRVKIYVLDCAVTNSSNLKYVDSRFTSPTFGTREGSRIWTSSSGCCSFEPIYYCYSDAPRIALKIWKICFLEFIGTPGSALKTKYFLSVIKYIDLAVQFFFFLKIR